MGLYAQEAFLILFPQDRDLGRMESILQDYIRPPVTDAEVSLSCIHT